MTPDEAGSMREEDKLERLWEAYRMATPAPEPSVNFMPELWAKIEASRPAMSWVGPLRHLVARLAPLMVVLIMMMGLYVWNPRTTTDVAHGGYVEILAADLLEDQQPALWMGEDAI